MIRPLEYLCSLPLREWTADELHALRQARVRLHRRYSRTKSSNATGYVLNDHDVLYIDRLSPNELERLQKALMRPIS